MSNRASKILVLSRLLASRDLLADLQHGHFSGGLRDQAEIDTEIDSILEKLGVLINSVDKDLEEEGI